MSAGPCIISFIWSSENVANDEFIVLNAPCTILEGVLDRDAGVMTSRRDLDFILLDGAIENRRPYTISRLRL